MVVAPVTHAVVVVVEGVVVEISIGTIGNAAESELISGSSKEQLKSVSLIG